MNGVNNVLYFLKTMELLLIKFDFLRFLKIVYSSCTFGVKNTTKIYTHTIEIKKFTLLKNYVFKMASKSFKNHGGV